MMDFQIFGGVLRSSIDFPELRRASSASAPDWTLSLAESLPAGNGVSLGEDVVDDNTRVRLYGVEDGYELRFDDTGTFAISRDGSRITWHQPAGASVVAARTDVMGRVLAVALHARGLVSLHGSAVAIDGQGIGFLAPKMHGKSTLAGALTRAGAMLATDDTLAVDVSGHPPRMWPGVHRLRLWHDSVAQVGASVSPISAPGDKLVLEEFSDAELLARPCPLAALYLLSPRKPGTMDLAVRRTALPSVMAALSLVRHSKLGPLLGGPEAQAMLARATTLAGAVPVYALEITRDFDRLGEVVETIRSWHHADAAVLESVA